MAEKRKDKRGIVLKTGERQKPNGKYEYRYKSKDGKRYSRSADTLTELRRIEDEVAKDRSDEIDASGHTKSINDVYKDWKKNKRGINSHTFSNYTYMYEKFVQPSFGKRKITTLKHSDVKRFYNGLIDNKAMKINTLDSVHTVLHQVIALAVYDDYIRYNPSDNALRELKSEHTTEKRHALTVEEQERLVDFLQNSKEYSHWYPIFFVMLNTGMRVGEICGLRWCDVDFENNIIDVNHTLVYYKNTDTKKCEFHINDTKTPAGFRTIPITEDVKVAFSLQKLYNKQHPCVANVDGYTDFVFVNRFGNVQHQGTLNKALRERIIKYANAEAVKTNKVLLPNFSCHYLRHTFCTNLCRAGVNITSIMHILGHKSIAVTMEIYAEATKDMVESAGTTFEEYLKNQASPQK